LERRFDETENIFYTHSNIDGVSESIIVIGDTKLNSQIVGYKFNHTILSLDIFLIKSPTYITGLVIKKIALKKIGFFNELLKQTEDSDYMIRTLFKSCIMSGILTKPVCAYVIHNTNTTSISPEKNLYRRNFYRRYTFFSIINFISFDVFLHFFTRYLVYDYLVLLDSKFTKSRILKIICLPLHIVRLIK
jgi:hypothetical protein